jgi:hypothetical protein
MEYLIKHRNDDFDVRSKFSSSNFENLPFLHPNIAVSAYPYVFSADSCLVSVSEVKQLALRAGLGSRLCFHRPPKKTSATNRREILGPTTP